MPELPPVTTATRPSSENSSDKYSREAIPARYVDAQARMDQRAWAVGDS
jgi:hypothetical protein